MKFFSFIISAVFLLSPASLFTEPPTGYEIVYQKQAAKNKEERIRDVQVMPGIIILNGGALFIFDEYDDYYRLTKTTLNLENKKELILKRSLIRAGRMLSPMLFPCNDGGLLIQDQRWYTHDTGYSLTLVHIGGDMKIKNRFESYQLGLTLPPFKSGQDFYYSLSCYNERKLEVGNEYIFIRSKNGAYLKTLNLNNKSSKELISLAFEHSWNLFAEYNSKYIALSNFELFSEKNFKWPSDYDYRKIKKNPSLYLFDPENERFDKIADFTKEINAAYKKLNGRKLKKSIYIHGLFYDYKTDRAVFMMQEDRETNEPPDNGHIVIYEMTAEKFRMIKLGDEFRSTYMTGTWDGIVYVSNWETGIVYGLKF